MTSFKLLLVELWLYKKKDIRIFLQQIVKIKFSDKFHCSADHQNTI